jgi:hypothetical protein
MKVNLETIFEYRFLQVSPNIAHNYPTKFES